MSEKLYESFRIYLTEGLLGMTAEEAKAYGLIDLVISSREESKQE